MNALESDVDCIVTGNFAVCLSRIFEKERGTGAAIRRGSFRCALKNAKIWQRKAGEEKEDKNAVSNDDDVWNYHCHYYGSCVSFVTVSNCFSK